MNCRRCQGLMIDDLLLDVAGTYGFMWTTSRRCVNCGQVYDSVIEQNRLAQQEKALVLSSGEPDYQDDEVHLGSEAFVRRTA